MVGVRARLVLLGRRELTVFVARALEAGRPQAGHGGVERDPALTERGFDPDVGDPRGGGGALEEDVAAEPAPGNGPLAR